jgi:phosphomannomutase
MLRARRMPGRVSASPTPDIFKAYDIRGIYPDQIDGDVAERIGGAFVRVLAGLEGKEVTQLRVGLGRDMRLSAPELAGRYLEGMLAAGAHVVDVGQVGSEMLYFLVGSRKLDGGLMCTASHNPKAYTGAKLVREGALALSGDSGIQDIRRAIEAESISANGGPSPAGVGRPQPASRGTIEELDIYGDFHAAALSFVDGSEITAAAERGLKVVVDGGNGMAGPMVGPLLDRLGLDPVETFWTPDGNFPEHEPNPLLPENRRFVIDKVIETGADLGIAWDGDADRCFFIDDTGAFVDGDFLTALLAESLLRKNPGAAILYDVRASRAVADTVRDAGGTAHVNRVGHAFFKTRMRKEGSLFGGEVSGHYYFRDFFCADSGTIPALLILELIAREGKRLSELLAPYRQRYFISGEVNSEVADPGAKIAEIEARYADARQDHLDGISIDYDDWHFNVRPSNTEPLLRLCLESLVSVQDMERRRDEVLGLIRGDAHSAAS